MDFKEILMNAEHGFQKNKEYFRRLRMKKGNLDQHIHALHRQVFENSNCLSCANCCITTGPLLTESDIVRLAKSLKMKPSVFVGQYLRIDEDNDYVFQSLPCPFLDAQNHCMVYKNRPTACREYPHTDRKNMRQILHLTLKNTLVCPVVYEIFERLKKELPS
jgi:uncharacterized protein